VENRRRREELEKLINFKSTLMSVYLPRDRSIAGRHPKRKGKEERKKICVREGMSEEENGKNFMLD
jgi:hypothetical protein